MKKRQCSADKYKLLINLITVYVAGSCGLIDCNISIFYLIDSHFYDNTLSVCS